MKQQKESSELFSSLQFAAQLEKTRNSEVSSNLQLIAAYLQNASTQEPVRGLEIAKKIVDSYRNNSTLNLFTPWGPRYDYARGCKIRDGDREQYTLDEMSKIQRDFKAMGLKPKWTIMFADLYGTQVNTLDQKFVAEYGANLQREAISVIPGAVVIPWSRIKSNVNNYSSREIQVANNLEALAGENLTDALETAKKFNPQNWEKSGRAYCIERIIEGQIIKDLFDPIKISAVKSEKDGLDGPLPRLYIIQNRRPWL